MGIILNEICCIDPTNITQSGYENTQLSQHDSNLKIEVNKSNRRKSINQFKNSSLESFPLNEIGPSFNVNVKQPKQVYSLSKIPISTKNVILQQTCNPLDYYDNIKKIGKGTFGTVYKVMHKQSGVIRAMKVISKNKLKYGFTDEDIIQEINILTKLEHPHIIKVYEFYNYQKHYYIINEFCNEGDLSEKLATLTRFPEFFVKILMIQIFNAVLYLHKKCVFHGDLKLENIMIDSLTNNEETSPTKKVKSDFISSLLEDEKEIDEYLKEKAMKRSNTITKKHKSAFNIYSSYNGQNGNNKGKIKGNRLSSSFLKKVNTIGNNKFFRKKRENEEEEKNNIKKKETEPMLKVKKRKSEFSFLNGEVSDSDEEKNSEENSSKDWDSSDEKEKEKDKMNNIKRYNENFVKHQLDIEKNINKKSKCLEIINEDIENPSKEVYEHKNNPNNNSHLKKSLTFNSLKIKNFEIKLIDFGCAKIFSKYKKNFGEIIGTLIYCSPEVLKNNYSKECDIWSCGIIMYVLLSGHFPFYAKTEDEIKKKILSGKFEFNPKYFSNISEKAKDLITKCLIYDKRKRISAQQALEHEFFMDDINPHNIFEDNIDTKNILLSLKNYSKHSKIYQTGLTYLSHNFSDKEELNKLKKIFYKIDLNLDGKLSKQELGKAFKEAGIEMTKKQLDKMMDSIDFDGNGYIEYEEFIRVALPKSKLFTETNLKIAFDMFDLDKNGTISLDEFKTILGINKIKNEKVNKELLKEIPIKENEEMTFEQFKQIFLG